MSKLSKLRGGNTAPVAIFSSNIESSAQNVLERMQSNKPTSNTSKFPVKKPYVPSRFKCLPSTTKRLVILDDKFSFGMKEHSLQGQDGKWTTERCISEYDSCPLCNRDNISVYDVAFLTVLDLTPWTKTNTDGTKTEYQFTKRILAVKKGDLPSFSGLLNVHGSFRGLVLDMARGPGQKETASGKPTYVATLSDDELTEEFGSEEVVSEKGTVIRPANDAIYAFNYDKFYPVPTRNELARKHDIPARPGAYDEGDDSAPPFSMDDEETVFTMDLDELPDVD